MTTPQLPHHAAARIDALRRLDTEGGLEFHPRGFGYLGQEAGELIPSPLMAKLAREGMVTVRKNAAGVSVARITEDGRTAVRLSDSQDGAPRPWTWRQAQKANGKNAGHNTFVVDAAGRTICSVYGHDREKTAQLIVTLANGLRT